MRCCGAFGVGVCADGWGTSILEPRNSKLKASLRPWQSRTVPRGALTNASNEHKDTDSTLQDELHTFANASTRICEISPVVNASSMTAVSRKLPSQGSIEPVLAIENKALLHPDKFNKTKNRTMPKGAAATKAQRKNCFAETLTSANLASRCRNKRKQ